ncbi:MAG: hypothetical protein DMF69_23945, partial [Acidobacteria bacterium]
MTSTKIAYVPATGRTMHPFKSQHIPALDGLRGVAILLVIIHHQLIPLSLNGGFLGVDLFFVLSGFLITSLLVKEFDATNSISLTKFYTRRVLRLAPALLLYLCVVLYLTYRQHPEEFKHELKLVFLSLTYLTNWRLAFGWDYSLDPTAIIWSLSIEEQFYLLWPPLLLLALWSKANRNHIVVALGFCILGIAVHRYSLFSHGAELNRMYYGSDTRADAPLVGCLVALLSLSRITVTKRVKAALNLGAFFSACLLIYLVATSAFTDHFLYRGGYTLVASASGLLVWHLAAADESFMTRILEFYPLRWFGLISYGLYLWHWLLLREVSFYRWVGEKDTAVRFVAAIVISAASFYLVERRFTRLK